jgi:DNA-binding NtrC family response regulator
MVRRFATSDAPVLITGESGTGKELAARAIHERSAFADGPFVAINCGGIPGELIASELFGYEKGAFTGARETKPGRIETAADGTLFLDEIGDLPLSLQAHLLRFLQDGAIERVGGLKSIRVPTRIVAGTNVDLDRAIEEGRFRADLFYRLNVLRLSLPALRERQDDAVLIAHHLVRAMRRDHGKPNADLTPGAIAAIRAHTWPGNVRELISALRRGLTMCRRSRISAEDLGIPRVGAAEAPPTLEAARTHAEQEAIMRALQYCGYRVRDAARALDISHVTLYSLMKKHNLSARYDSGSMVERQRV